MANTIRRTPVSFDIPDSPDYKFLNITDFRGIAISDNPFTLSSNTASDMLNLYVDETNTLTTRPRLELYESIKKSHPDMTKFLGLYPLSFGFLLHYTKPSYSSEQYELELMYISNNTLQYKVVSGDIPQTEKLIVFEQNDNIYIVANGYRVITYEMSGGTPNNVQISDVQGYVPTIMRGGTNLAAGTKDEDYNLLSNSYKIDFRWDGTWNPNDIKISESDTLDNQYRITYSLEHNFTPYRFIESSFADMDKETLTGGKWIVNRLNRNYLEQYTRLENVWHSDSYGVPSSSLLPDRYDNLFGDGSSDGSIVAYYYYSSVVDTGTSSVDGCVLVKRNDVWHSIIRDADKSCNTLNGIKMNDDGNVLAIGYSNANDVVVEIYSWNNVDSTYAQIYTKSFPSSYYRFDTFELSRNGNTLIYAELGEETIVSNILSGTPVEISKKLTSQINRNFTISDDGALIFWREYDIGHLGTIENNTIIEKKNLPSKTLEVLGKIDYAKFSPDNSKLYVLKGTMNRPDVEGWIVLNDYTNSVFVPNSFASATQDILAPYVTNDAVIYAYEISNRIVLQKIRYDFGSETPLLTLTHTISSDDDIYDDFIERQNLLYNAIISTRFNNERWFASKNIVFFTSGNNPTYVPYMSTTILGESDENVTGFNLVQDDLLIIYKDNYIWAMSPQTFSNTSGSTTTDYSVAETKNTVGNNAVGASIVSAYRELPLQIAYDGIYALSQLTNVYASDRISESISDNIAKKWLQEDRSVIQNAKTINRLYWTYVILSYEKITKVYLLDNRTTSWFYWELPISVVNAFVKDNVVYMAHTDGTVYTLQTSEIINKYNPNLTEYYDDGEQIINWYWKSQILPLGTINYSKRLIDTTFIFTDTDSTDEYSLDYKFTAYRKVVSQTNATTISNQLNYIQSTTKKTLINRCNFIQLELSNSVDDLNNNKLRLVGLGFKYVLLEGLL